LRGGGESLADRFPLGRLTPVNGFPRDSVDDERKEGEVAVLRVIEDAGSPICTPVGFEAETFVPRAKQLTDEAFEAKVKEIFGLD
jgi:hypothetical protein